MPVVIARANLNEQVYETLRDRILRRDPGPGTKLSLHELAAELGVSRSPVHHALTRLVTEGLLTVRSRRGYYVTPVTVRALDEGYEVRLALELHAAEGAVGRITTDEIAQLRELMEATAAAVSHEEWDTANAAFHEFQVDLAGNELLSRFYRELSVNLMMQVIRGGRLEAGSYLATEHGAIVAGFEARDLAATKDAIRAHIATGRRIALDAIEAAGGIL
jgi:DNA-binding GntR family transcriptional regulator